MKISKKEINILRRVLGYIPRPFCGDLHHPKKHRHCLSVQCPVEEELNKNIEEAYKIIYKLEYGK
jgi:hypothetical protein